MQNIIKRMLGLIVFACGIWYIIIVIDGLVLHFQEFVLQSPSLVSFLPFLPVFMANWGRNILLAISSYRYIRASISHYTCSYMVLTACYSLIGYVVHFVVLSYYRSVLFINWQIFIPVFMLFVGLVIKKESYFPILTYIQGKQSDN